jgi:hypothetical protein
VFQGLSPEPQFLLGSFSGTTPPTNLRSSLGQMTVVFTVKSAPGRTAPGFSAAYYAGACQNTITVGSLTGKFTPGK